MEKRWKNRIGGPVPAALVRLSLLLSLVATTACAYRFGYGGRRVPGGYDRVAVPVFQNKTHEVGIETPFTNALIREFEQSKVAHVVSQSDAQVTLNGVIEGVSYLPTAQAQLQAGTVLTTDFRVLVTMRLELRRNSDQKVIWSNSFQGERSYSAPRISIEGLNSANALYNQSARFQTITLMASDLMSEAHDRITENF